MNYYCSDCGAKTQYNSTPPKFCGTCGKPLGTSIASVSLSQSKSKPVLFYQSQSQVEEIPQLEKLEINIKQRAGNLRKETIGAIWGSEAIDPGRIDKTSKPKKASNKKILEEFKIEATPRSRDNSIEING